MILLDDVIGPLESFLGSAWVIISLLVIMILWKRARKPLGLAAAVIAAGYAALFIYCYRMAADAAAAGSPLGGMGILFLATSHIPERSLAYFLVAAVGLIWAAVTKPKVRATAG